MSTSDEWARRKRAREEAARKRRRRKQIWLAIALSLLVLLSAVAVWLDRKAPDSGPDALNVPAQTAGRVQTEAPGLPQTETAAPPETAATEPPQTEAPPTLEIAKATISVTGDILPHIPVINTGLRGDTYNYDSIFTYIKDYASQADFTVANLETTLAGEENGYAYSGFPKFNCPDAMVDALKNAGFDMLLTANNHSYDTDAFGLNRTQEVIADRGLLHLGTTQSADEAKYLVQDINGIKVGMVCYTYGQISGSTGQKSVNGRPISQSLTEQINVFDYTKLNQFYSEMEELLAAMKAEGAEATVLFIHWGNEYQLKPNSYQTAIAQKMCDLGVDVIVGGHPHVIEPVELLTSSTDPAHRTLCVYSVGNAVSNQRGSNMNMNTGHTEDGMLFSFTFVKYFDGSVFLDSAEILPTWVYIRSSGSSKSYEILPLDMEIPDWEAAFDFGSTGLKNAQASYDRTLALIGPGMEEADAYYDQSRADRELECNPSENGVG